MEKEARSIEISVTYGIPEYLGHVKIFLWKFFSYYYSGFKGALSGVKQFLTSESPLKMIKKQVFRFLSCLFLSCRKMAWLERQG